MRRQRFHHRDWTARLSEYLSGELEEADEQALEAHLAVCDDCNAALRELTRVVDEAGALGDIEPPADLWPGIAAALASGAARQDEEPRVIAFPGVHPRAGAPPVTGSGRVAFSRGGLVAASVVLVALSGTAAWFAGRSTSLPAAPPPAAVGTDAVSLAAGDDAGAPPAMAGELAVLEDVLSTARTALDPNTVRVLERNLGVIERAIAESREALALDPGNTFLAEHLERMYRRKLVYLQDAVRLVEFGG